MDPLLRFLKDELPMFVLDLCVQNNLPPQHVSAVVHRAEMALIAVASTRGYAPLAGPTIVLAASLEGVDHDIASFFRGCCRKVVKGAVADHGRGVLERRC